MLNTIEPERLEEAASLLAELRAKGVEAWLGEGGAIVRLAPREQVDGVVIRRVQRVRPELLRLLALRDLVGQHWREA